MSETDQEQTESANLPENDTNEPGFLHIAEDTEQAATETSSTLPPSQAVTPATPLASQSVERAGTAEHLAARRPVEPLDVDSSEIKQRLTTLRADVTRLLTSLRWEDLSLAEAANQFVSLLDLGPIPQWRPVLIPFLYEIDRGGVLIPVWLSIIEQGDMPDLPADANPAETTRGRARRYAISMLGNYRTMGISGGDFNFKRATDSTHFSDLTQYLGYLSTDPDTSLYATQSLVKHATVPALEALVGALKTAQGWAKVDVVESCLSLQQERFYDLLLASGLDNAPGLETYLALPLYRTLPLEKYLEQGNTANSHLSQNAALVFNQVLLDNQTQPASITDTTTLPAVFARHLPTMANALFTSARSNPCWQYTLALHRLALFLGRYWSEISRGTIKDVRVVEPVYHCLPMMNEVERWMSGPGRDVLLEALASAEISVLPPLAKVLGEMREPRAVTPLTRRIETIQTLPDRPYALAIGSLCETLALLGDRRSQAPLLQMVNRTIDIPHRSHQPKLRDNLPLNSPDVPGSIVYAAAIRACGQLNDRFALIGVLNAASDLDPYVRAQALDAIKRLDPNGEDARSRQIVREALSDPRNSIVRSAALLVVQYHDLDALPQLRDIIDDRPEIAYAAQDAIRQLGH